MPDTTPSIQQGEHDVVTVIQAAHDDGGPKAFFKSKRFWTTVATVGLHYAGFLPTPYAVIIPLVANILLPTLDQINAANDKGADQPTITLHEYK